MKRLVALGLLTLGVAVAPLGAVHAGATAVTSSAISVSPNPAAPGTNATATATFGILGPIADGDELSFIIDVQGTAGNGTVTAGTSSLAGGTCSIDAGTNRAYICRFPSAVVNANAGTFTMSATIAIAPATPDTPPTWAVNAAGRLVAQGVTTADSFDTTQLSIQAPPPSTAAPTTAAPTTAAPTTTAPTTAAPTAAVPTTSPSGGQLPATGNANSWIALLAAVLVGAGVSVIAVARRGASH